MQSDSMQDPTSFYQSQLTKFQKQLQTVKTTLNTLSLIRLVLFLAVLAAVYFVWGNTQIILGVLVIATVFFIALLIRYNTLKYERDFLKALIKTNETELKVLNRDFHDLPDGKEYAQGAHDFSQDIDLFGRGSFFQYSNRTALKSGTDRFVHGLLSNHIQNVDEKQEGIKELAALPEWRQQFGAVATLVKTEVSVTSVVNWLHQYSFFVPKKAQLISILFSALSILVWALYFLNFISGYLVFAVFLLGLAITGKYLKSINKLAIHTAQIQSTFRQYAKLIALLETQDFDAKALGQERAKVIGAEGSSSTLLKKFAKLLDALDQRNNILISLVANGFFLRDLYICKSIEDWILNHGKKVSNWFDAIAFFDAYCSLGNFAFNHPRYVYPFINQDQNTIDCKGAVHPLLDTEMAIANDYCIANDQFFVVTGANMAGKSTFLRTVGLQIVMANVGLPVAATEAKYTPIKLITSMRTTDSLTDDESYFFSELKRLKFIIDKIEEEPHFIILDEILKGTNSTDKAEGSKKFIERLVRLKASGIIATHDLSLCAVADSLKEVKNYYFDAQIKNDELYFDYAFKEGVCQNMNASFLLAKMGIVDDASLDHN
ncbi:MutS-related protein [Croceitalea sp. P059]|uniref:MutS-related protein n=1 Tax=Croceitalea sp. P059 TaxID=3075601 RepID=UPI0028860E93|nr:DNA mismatch repair protein MutS [Croceitalea sp. P059]MDT0538875.1 DNA mismatch repair protein MutS [Croceitalea sp. P059]